jgi:hypothetical protein
VIELLAIAPAGAAPEPPVRAVPSDGVSVLCAEAGAEAAPDAGALWRHEALLERLMETGPLLPVRYGTRVADEAAAAASVAGRGEALRERLEHVRGAVELAVRVRDGGEAPPAESVSGTEYLRARSGRARLVEEALSPLARDARVRLGRELRAAYLVDRDAVEPFVARVRELQGEHDDLAILCTGPWPAYSFAEGAA